MDGGASISWKLLNAFKTVNTCLYDCLGKCLPYWVTNRNGIAFQLPFRNVGPLKNAQLAPKPASTGKLTPVTAQSRLNNARIECSLNRNF